MESLPHLRSFATRREFVRAALLASGALALGTRGSVAQNASPEAGNYLHPAPEQEGGTLRVAFEGSGAFESLNKLAFTAIDYYRQSLVLEALARFDGAGQEMLLAEAITPNEDGSVWTIALRGDVRWHDGDPFTAIDVLSSLNYYADPAGGGILYGPLVAAIDLPNARVVDELTLELSLVRPANDLHLLIGGGELLIFKDGFADETTLMGTGPFILSSFTPAQSTTLTRNPDYWGYPERGPFVDQVELLSISGGSTRTNAVEGGQADFAPAIPFADGARLRGHDALDLLASESPDVQAMPFVMNIQVEPFSDIRLRHAVKLGTDRQALIDAAFLGFGVIGNDLYGIGQSDYNAGIPQREHDPETAQALVAEAGAEGLQFDFLVPGDYGGAVEAATILVEQLRGIGLEPQLQTVPLDAYSAQLGEAGGPPAPFRFGVGAGYLMRTSWQFMYTPGAATNLTGWNDPEWLAAFDESQTTPDPERRRELLDALQETLWDQGGDLVWGFSQSLAVKTRNLVNVRASYYPPLGRAFFTGE